MERKILIIMILIMVLFAGCSNDMVDKKTKYDLPVLESLENNQFTHIIHHDGMNRSKQYSADAELVIDANYYDKKEINRGDVVYYKTSATEVDIKNKVRSEFDIARVIALPNETLSVVKGQIYINNRKLDTFYGREYYMDDYINGTKQAYTMEKEISIPRGHYFLASDVWWRIGFHSDSITKTEIRGKVIGWLKKDTILTNNR